jgi:hypothetical protein
VRRAIAGAMLACAMTLGAAQAQDALCFRMTPFEDEVMLQPSAIDGALTPGFYSIFAHWWGNGQYYIEGGGDGQVSSDGKRGAVSFIFNNHTSWGNGHGPGRFVASLDFQTWRGPWTISITGQDSQTPYLMHGLLVSKLCRDVGNVPKGDPPNLVLIPFEE